MTRREAANYPNILQAQNLLGGLDTRSPPHRLMPSQSPDLKNVTMSRGSVQSRGGFVPYVKDVPRLSCIKNRGFRTRAKCPINAASAESDYVTVGGALYAGHRAIYDEPVIRDAITIECWVRPADLGVEHGGNANEASASPAGPAPFSALVRPILSKGPIKRDADQGLLGAPQASNSISWRTASRWGPNGAGQHACPFFLYLFWNGTNWEFRFSFHYLDGGNWQIATQANDANSIGYIAVDRCYHLIASYSISTGLIELRVGIANEGAMVYQLSQTSGFGSSPQEMPETTPCPIQVFDCPQDLIEAPATPSATRPPGLGLGSLEDGGYFFASRRFEGDIEDIAIYRTAIAPLLQQTKPMRRDSADPLWAHLVVNHWPGDSPRAAFAEERTGATNHLVKSPYSPTLYDFQDTKGWQFNGLTSYALAELSNENFAAGSEGGNPNWRYMPSDLSPRIDGAFQYIVRNNLGHGLEVTFTPDSIEPNFEQVIAEAHSVMRLVILTDGRLGLYVRDGAGGGAAQLYQDPLLSYSTVVPGKRYTVVAYRYGTLVQIFLNGTLESSSNTFATCSATGYPVGGLTFGMGALSFTSRTSDPSGNPGADTQSLDVVDVDHRSGFMGRIDSARVIVGEPPPLTGSLNDDSRFREDRYSEEFSSHWEFQTGVGNIIRCSSLGSSGYTGDGYQIIPSLPLGSVLDTDDNFDGARLAYVVTSTASSGTFSSVALHTARRPRAYGGIGGLNRHVSAKSSKALGAWDFDEEDIDRGYNASHDHIRYGFGGGGAWDIFHHIQRGALDDELNFLNRIQRRSIPPDILTRDPAKLFSGVSHPWRHQHTPYRRNGPREIAPTFADGMLTPRLDDSPITMLQSWHHQLTGNQFLIGATRRKVLWIRKPFAKESPFDDRSYSAFFFGGTDRLRGAVSAIGSSVAWASHTAVIECWVKPIRQDGHRMILMSGDVDPTNDPTFRYMIFTVDGFLHVMGTQSADRAWQYAEGFLTLSPTMVRRHATIVTGQWNHIYVEISGSGVVARVNGKLLQMSDLSTVSQGNVITAGTIRTAANFYVGGLDEHRLQMSVPFGGGPATIDLPMQSYIGYITDVRERDAASPLWNAGESGAPPRSRSEADGNTRLHYPISADTGWACPSGTLEPPLSVAIREVRSLADDLGDSGSTAHSSVIYRDRLYATNGKDRPFQVIHTTLDDLGGPFRVFRVGIEPPGRGSGASFLTAVNPGTGIFSAGTHEVYMTYSNSDGTESDPEFLASVVANDVFEELLVSLVPISADPQVAARNFYVGLNGSTPTYASTCFNNTSRDFNITATGGGQAALGGLRVPPQRARIVSAGGGKLYFANLDGNQNSLIFSDANSLDYYPAENVVVIDSENGRPITAAKEHLGSFFLFKRDATWRLFAGPFQADLRSVNIGTGAAGGATVYDNVIFGIGNRGVFRFDGANSVYASADLEEMFRSDISLDDEDLLQMRGGYFWSESVLVESVRRRNRKHKDTLLVLHTAVSDRQVWTTYEVPDHVECAVVLDPVEQLPRLLLGGSSGQVLVYDANQHADGITLHPSSSVPGVISGSIPATYFGSGLLTDLSGLDVDQLGLRAAPILVTYQGVNYTGRVVRNTVDSILMDPAPPIPNSSPVDVVIGYIDAYWTSGWLAPQMMGSDLLAREVDFEFEESDGVDLAVEFASAKASVPRRSFPSTAESTSFLMTDGFLDQPLPVKTQNRGRYFRLKFGTIGSDKRFSVTGYAIRFDPTGFRGSPT